MKKHPSTRERRMVTMAVDKATHARARDRLYPIPLSRAVNALLYAVVHGDITPDQISAWSQAQAAIFDKAEETPDPPPLVPLIKSVPKRRPRKA